MPEVNLRIEKMTEEQKQNGVFLQKKNLFITNFSIPDIQRGRKILDGLVLVQGTYIKKFDSKVFHITLLHLSLCEFR